MRKQCKRNLIDYLTFMLNKNAEMYGYVVDYDVTWNTSKQYIKDIFELEMGIITERLPKVRVHSMLIEWLNDLDCLVSVIENLDYSDNYKLDYFIPKRLEHKSQQAKLDYINNQIFALLYS